ncbi:LLM class flavin-dependent oxidoreductase [Nocardia lasii]|uniref:LLM class flavin-dependent oxidoreductase n=1 Tax=Nocardia lasii TaxID=1616107 RepID=A0ABW1JRU1_9NOCA
MTPVVGIEIADAALARSVGPEFAAVPRLLDAAGIGYVVLGADRATGTAESLSPALAGTLFARHSHGLGIVAAASPQRDHPYNIARRLGSLDHLTHGRAGWLALREDRATTLGQGHGSWTDRPVDAAGVADAVTAVRALWRTWPIETLTRADDSVVRYADHTGEYPTTGPLNVPTTPQGEPVVWWRYERGDDPARVAVADVVLVDPDDLDAELPAAVHRHVRLEASDLAPRTGNPLAELPDIHGVAIRVDLPALPDFLDRTLPALADAGLLRLRPSDETRTLRAHLGIDRRKEPDLSRHRPVFAAS